MNPVLINRFTYKAQQELSDHSHDHTQVTMVVSGTMEEMVNGQRQFYGPLDILIKPAGTVHSNDFGVRGADTIQFSLDPEWLDESPELRALCQYRSFFCPNLNRAILHLFAEIPSNNRMSNKDSVIAFERVKSNFVSAAMQPGISTRPDWLESIVAAIKNEPEECWSLKEASSGVEKHRVSIARAFKQHYGVTFKQMQQQIRVKRAARLLADSEKQLAAVSADCGFADQSHLTRVFKSQTGMTPNQFRQLAR